VHTEAKRQISRLPAGSSVRVTITDNPEIKDFQS